MDKLRLKQILVSNQKDVERYQIVPRSFPLEDFPCLVLVGVRRAGKSFLMFQKIQENLKNGVGWNRMLYLNFEDDRLENFSINDFDLILEAHYELYGERPMLFLDEVQNIAGWEKFARRLADNKYKVWITGSNAKMLSSEIMTTLGGRYLMREVYPFSFKEYLDALTVYYDELSLLSTESRAEILRVWGEYLEWGGFPEAIFLPVKRNYLSSIFQKIYLGDICSRNNISNPNHLRVLIKKLAENVKQPISYNRLANILSTVNGKISMPTVSRYIEFCESSWILLRLRNVTAPFAERETACKYYFIDNGLLHLFLIDNITSLFENMVALSLFRKYGNDKDNERVFFYNETMEVDFYIPEENMAIQASYFIGEAGDTYDREVGALQKLPGHLTCNRRIIITNDEERIIEDPYGMIEIIPLWKWLMSY